jgi:pyrimidine operon attenuation protein / uracil phosphoribosyltransferase
MERLLCDSKRIELTVQRLAYQIIENHGDFQESIFISLQPRGILFGNALKKVLESKINKIIANGELDCTFYRDDFRRNDKILLPNAMQMEESIENKKVILVDDVLFTGRTIRAALDALNDFGRPRSVELVTLINRKFKREVPVHPDYSGITVDTRANDYVRVDWNLNEGKVWIIRDTDKL